MTTTRHGETVRGGGGDASQSGMGTWLGVTVKDWIWIFQTVGFPTFLLGCLLYAAWSYIPQVVDGHLLLLQQTGETLSKMDDTLKQSNAVLAEVADIQRETKIFMRKVDETHQGQDKKLDLHTEKLETIERVIKPPQ